MYKLNFYVPESHLEIVKQAIFKAGAGTMNNYSHCCWQILGEGQFMPLAASNPFLGKKNHLEKVAEYKVETVCQDENLNAVIKALKDSHPYETLAYEVWLLENI